MPNKSFMNSVYTYRQRWLGIACWFREHVWSLLGIDYHYDGSTTWVYECRRCGLEGHDLTH